MPIYSDLFADLNDPDLLVKIRHAHTQLRQTPFLKLFLGISKTESLSLNTYYSYLKQIQAIYEIMIDRLNSFPEQEQLPPSLAFILNRGKDIESDLNFLAQYVNFPARDVLLIPTEEYRTHLYMSFGKGEKLDKPKFLAFFLTVFIDQFWFHSPMRKMVKELYLEEKIYSENNPGRGLAFFAMPSCIAEQPEDLIKWLGIFFNFKVDNLSEETIDVPDKLCTFGIDNEEQTQPPASSKQISPKLASKIDLAKQLAIEYERQQAIYKGLYKRKQWLDKEVVPSVQTHASFFSSSNLKWVGAVVGVGKCRCSLCNKPLY